MSMDQIPEKAKTRASRIAFRITIDPTDFIGHANGLQLRRP